MSLPQLQRTWSKSDVADELRDALAIVNELQPPDDLRVAVFNLAAQALMQRAQTVGAAIDLSQLPNLRG